MAYNYDDFNGEALIYKYNIDENGNPVSIAIEEQKAVSTHGTIQLEQIPDELNRIVMLNENGTQMFEVFNRDDIRENSYYIDYENGVAYFNKDNFEKVKVYNYYGKGIQLIGCSRIYDEHDVRGQHVMLTLQEIIDAGRECIRILLDIGDAYQIITRLEEDIKNGTILHENLLDDIAVGTPLQENLHADITEAKKWKDQLHTDVTEGKVLQPLLHNDIIQGNLTKEELEQTIADAQEDINTINATSNDIKYITKNQWALNSASGMYEYMLPHTMNSKALTINCYYTDTDEFAFIGGKIIDKNNILFKNEEAINLTIVLNSKYYKATMAISDDIASEVQEARGGESDLKTRIDKLSGRAEMYYSVL